MEPAEGVTTTFSEATSVKFRLNARSIEPFCVQLSTVTVGVFPVNVKAPTVGVTTNAAARLRTTTGSIGYASVKRPVAGMVTVSVLPAAKENCAVERAA